MKWAQRMFRYATYASVVLPSCMAIAIYLTRTMRGCSTTGMWSTRITPWFACVELRICVVEKFIFFTAAAVRYG